MDYAGKTALDLRDELTAMKKNLSATEEQRDIFRGEMMKYKQILVKKDKEIEDLIMSGHVSTRDTARINTGNKSDVLLVRKEKHTCTCTLYMYFKSSFISNLIASENFIN